MSRFGFVAPVKLESKYSRGILEALTVNAYFCTENGWASQQLGRVSALA